MAGIAVVGLAVFVAALFEQWGVAFAGSAVLLSATLVALLDLRQLLRYVRTQIEGLIEGVEIIQGEQSSFVDALARNEDTRGVSELGEHVSVLLALQTREIEAMLQLFARIEPQGPMPPSGGFALRPSGLLNIYTLVQRHRPEIVVELGSGTSTVWVAHALAANRRGRIVSLEHSEAFAEQTRATFRYHEGVLPRVEIRHAQLKHVRIGDEEYRWYNPDCILDLSGIDLLIVDGPPGSTGACARYPALPLLVDRLADGAVIVLDDANRESEQVIVARWIDEVPGLLRDPVTLGDQAVLHYRPGHARD